MTWCNFEADQFMLSVKSVEAQAAAGFCVQGKQAWRLFCVDGNIEVVSSSDTVHDQQCIDFYMVKALLPINLSKSATNLTPKNVCKKAVHRHLEST